MLKFIRHNEKLIILVVLVIFFIIIISIIKGESEVKDIAELYKGMNIDEIITTRYPGYEYDYINCDNIYFVAGIKKKKLKAFDELVIYDNDDVTIKELKSLGDFKNILMFEKGYSEILNIYKVDGKYVLYIYIYSVEKEIEVSDNLETWEHFRNFNEFHYCKIISDLDDNYKIYIKKKDGTKYEAATGKEIKALYD